MIVGESDAVVAERIRAVAKLGQSEVEHLHVAGLGERDVRRLQIAMHDAFVMRRLQRERDLTRDFDRLVQRYGAALERLASVPPSTSSRTRKRADVNCSRP